MKNSYLYGMNQLIRHRRLYAFYNSKVLNAMMITTIVSLMTGNCTGSLLLPVVCASLALAFFLGYSLWLWIKKPQRIVINTWLSGLDSLYVFYFLIVSAMKAPGPWWYIAPAACAVATLFISLVRNHDEEFEICKPQP